MKSKVLAILLTGVLAVSMLVGCQKTSESPAASQTGEKESDIDENSNSNENSQDGEAVKVYAATGGSPKPFTYVDDNDELTGHNIELIKAVFDKLPQYELVFEKTDFPSIFAGLDSDRYQIGVNNFAMNEERKEKYLFTDPMFENRYVAIVAADNEELDSVQSLADLAGKNLVGQTAINSTTAVENYNQENPDNQININYTEEDLVMQLQNIESGKYEFLIIDKPMYEYYDREYHFNLKVLELSDEVSSGVMAEPYSYFIVSKGNEQLVADINEALKEVIADGTSKEINEKYFGEDYTP